MAIRLREVAASCLGIGGTFSVRRDVFGYVFGPLGQPLRLTQHLQRIRGRSINLSLILVAHEPDFSGEFSLAEAQAIQVAIEQTRQLYAQVGLGVRKLYWQFIPVADAGGYATVDASEATELTEEWSGANDGVDVFWVSNVTDASGWSNTDGPCDKNEGKERTGAVLELGGLNGIVLAHEIGHYLELQHANALTNVMGVDSNNDGIGEIDGTSTNLTAAQGATMHASCFVQSPC